MAEIGIKDIRTFGLFSHSSAGKTSLAEAILYSCKMTSRLGSVMQGNTISDYNPDEIERKISISLKSLFADYREKRLYMIDTPGYADFFGEVINAARAVDSAILLIDATGGIEVGTERVWKLLEELNMPRIVFINKLDKENTDFYKTLESIGKRFQKRIAVLTLPVGVAQNFKGVVNLLTGDLTALGPHKERAETLKRELIEAASESDDALLEKYLEGKELTFDEIKSGLRKGILDGKVVLVLCGSATANIGIQDLLDAVVELAPSPADLPARVGFNPKNKEEKKVAPNDETAPFSAYVFKTISDPYVGQLTLFRVYSGKLSSDSTFYNSTKEMKERFGPILILQGKEQISTSLVKAGEIAAIAKLKETSTGDTICDEKGLIVFEVPGFPEAAISASVKPHSKQDEEKIMDALQRLSFEDITFKVARDPQTKELIISGMGDLHLDVMIERLKKRFGVGVDIGTPKVPYKETIKAKASVQGKYKRQSGGRGQYGDCWIEVEPIDVTTDLEFVDKIVGGAIPRNYIPAVEKGVKDAMQQGVLAGYPVTGVRVTLYDGSFHPVDSSDLAFQIAGSMAFKKAQEQAKPILLEPIMEVEVFVPEEYMGQITGDLNGRRGRILGIEPSGGLQMVKATVPLAEMFKYASELRSMTGGRGTYSMRFLCYDEVPAKIAQMVIEQAKKQAEEVKK